MDGVDQQVADCALQHQSIALDGDLVAAQFETDIFSQNPVILDQALAQTAQRDLFRAGRNQSMLGLGQKQHVADDPRQALVLFEVGGQQVAIFVGVAHLAERDLGLYAQGVDRRPQLVGEVGREVGKAPERFLQAPEHCVEGGDQLGQLGRHVALGNALGQLAGRDAPGGVRQFAHRPHAAAGDQHADGDREQRRGQHRQPEVALQLVEEGGVVVDVAGDDHAHRLAPGRLHAPGDDPQVLPGQGQAHRRVANAGRRRRQHRGLPARGPEENRPFFTVDRNQHPVLADQRIGQPGRQSRRRPLPAADVARQRQLAEQFVGVELGHVTIGRAAQVDAKGSENQRRQQREGE